MTYQSEAQLEQLLIQRLKSQGFNEVKIDNEQELMENFKEKFSLFNQDKLKNKPLTEKEWQRVTNDIMGKGVFGSAKKLRDKVFIKREDESDLYLNLLNTTDISKNIFEVTHQTTVVGKYTNRYDVTLLINGLPIVQIELKRRGMDIKEAFNQIERYRKHSYKGLYRYIQIFVITNGIDTKYFSNSDRNILYSHTFFWTNEKNERLTNLNDFTQAFLTPNHLIKMMESHLRNGMERRLSQSQAKNQKIVITVIKSHQIIITAIPNQQLHHLLEALYKLQQQKLHSQQQ